MSNTEHYTTLSTRHNTFATWHDYVQRPIFYAGSNINMRQHTQYIQHTYPIPNITA
ncbi:hypothetical protein L211DRAFT_838199 [Terfezia boudieri ATCC MYA-4762]|uniref:Uncharacterized protein n=1 Tax=Terfezia boudieri ATCC MYA-4762 TaxID=1051890 RepID=A0A3N4LR94_9PEZI|nr:hypothetical protein L211DRAFT_838199 [Terfezia boudieri ATCC MYA-4762]